jgi:hypothetical protein
MLNKTGTGVTNMNSSWTAARHAKCKRTTGGWVEVEAGTLEGLENLVGSKGSSGTRFYISHPIALVDRSPVLHSTQYRN